MKTLFGRLRDFTGIVDMDQPVLLDLSSWEPDWAWSVQ